MINYYCQPRNKTNICEIAAHTATMERWEKGNDQYWQFSCRKINTFTVLPFNSVCGQEVTITKSPPTHSVLSITVAFKIKKNRMIEKRNSLPVSIQKKKMKIEKPQKPI